MRLPKTIWIAAIFIAISTAGVMYYSSTRVDDREIRISSNPWVGFTPFIYAQEKGWLENTPFKFIWVVDLSENSRLYDRRFTQGFTATQYEMLHFKDSSHIRPVFLIDRSAGADVILSNQSLNDLRQLKKPIKAYLEKGSLNEDLFNAFVKENHLENLNFTTINSSQKGMVEIDPKAGPAIVISYVPYSSALIKRGFSIISSTKSLHSIFVIDAIFADERSIRGHEKDFRALREIFARAYKQLRTNPQEFYQTIHGYLEGQSYDDFMASTTQIQWLHHGDDTPYVQFLQEQHIQTSNLLP